MAWVGAECGRQRRGKVRCWAGWLGPAQGVTCRGSHRRRGPRGQAGWGSGINYPRRSKVALTLVKEVAEEAGWMVRLKK